MRYALIDHTTNRVENIILWDGQTALSFSNDWLIREVKEQEECRIGDIWDGSRYNDPTPPIPMNPLKVELVSKIEPKPLEYNGIGWHTVAQGPLKTGQRSPLDGKPGIWLIGDKIPGIEGYSVTRVA